MQTLITIDRAREAKIAEWMGPSGHNDVPPNFREVSEEEIAHNSPFLSYSPDAVDFRQFKINNRYESVTMYIYYDQTGVGLIKDYTLGKIRWFKFGCHHQYKEIERPGGHRSGIHVDQCQKCGYKHSYDTSD